MNRQIGFSVAYGWICGGLAVAYIPLPWSLGFAVVAGLVWGAGIAYWNQRAVA